MALHKKFQWLAQLREDGATLFVERVASCQLIAMEAHKIVVQSFKSKK